MLKTNAQTVLKMVIDDVERDATNFDGKPFAGKTVGEYFGNHGAAIVTIAKILSQLIVEQDKEMKELKQAFIELDNLVKRQAD